VVEVPAALNPDKPREKFGDSEITRSSARKNASQHQINNGETHAAVRSMSGSAFHYPRSLRLHAHRCPQTFIGQALDTKVD